MVGVALLGRFGVSARKLRRPARQEVFRHLADDWRPLGREEADDQADLLLFSSQFIPRDPHAVGMADARHAVVFGEEFLGEDELAIRPGIAGVAARLIEGIDHQRAVDFDRLIVLSAVEQQPTAEPALRRTVRVVQYRVGPDGHDPAGQARLVFRGQWPRQRFLQIQLRAAGKQRESRRRHQQVQEPRGDGHGDSFHGISDTATSAACAAAP
jgi:hypothetical protein